jgi:parallel beta-helix repeat protein
MAIYIMTVFVLIFASRKNVLVFAGPPASGDWVVTGTESYYDQVFVLNGNLIVEAGGNLTFRKVTLKMNCAYDGQYNITVKGGKFYVLEGSIITSVDPDKEYSFEVGYGSTFRMKNSELHECGWNSSEGGKTGLFFIESVDTVVENSLISHNWVIFVCTNATIQNNIITKNRKGIFCPSSSPTISGNRITENLEGGIECNIYSSPTIVNDTIAANLGYTGGIHLMGHCDAIIQGNIVANNSRGITFGENSNPTIFNNKIISNSEYGIGFFSESNPIIQDNIIAFNGGVGVGGGFNCSPTIQGNNITSNNGFGILLHNNTQGKIQGNVIANNFEGIHLDSHCNPLVQGNIIKSNQGIGVSCDNNSLPEIHRNDIYGNKAGVENHDLSVTVNATYNYWGNSPSASSNVLYNPWLKESIFSAEITSPLSGEIVSSTVTVSTRVHAQNGFDKVGFYLDEELEYTDYNMPCEWIWDTRQYAETEHKITAKAYDMLGLKISTSITVFVDNTAPTVSIKEPRLENVYYGILRVSVNATDNKELSKVHFRVDNTEWLPMTYNLTDLLWKYDLNTSTLSDGQHTLIVLALDKASNPATTSVTLVTDNGPPTLTIQTPQSGMTVGLTLIVNVQASDTSGISKIEFYLEDVLVYTVTGTPYQWSWDTTEYPNGEYAITIKAYDTVGHIQTSQTTVTVKNVEPQWWQTHFWTIMQVLVAIGGLILAVLTYLTRKKEKKKETDE